MSKIESVTIHNPDRSEHISIIVGPAMVLNGWEYAIVGR
jgi:hypothetical protein